MDSEDKNTAGINAEDKDTAGINAEDKDTAGINAEDKNTAGINAEDKNTAGINAEDKNVAENNKNLNRSQELDIPILLGLAKIALPTVNNAMCVWKNYIYFLAHSTNRNILLIIEADINTRTIIRSIPITFRNHKDNIFGNIHIFRTDDCIGLIYDNDSIFIKKLATNQEFKSLYIRCWQIYDVITHGNKLFIAMKSLYPIAENFPNIKIDEKLCKTSYCVISIDCLTNTIDRIFPAWDERIYQLDILDNKLIICQSCPKRMIYDLSCPDADPRRVITQQFIQYAKYDNTIYQYRNDRRVYGGVSAFPVPDNYKIIDTSGTPMENLDLADIINEKLYIGITRDIDDIDEPVYLNAYNLETGQLIKEKIFDLPWFEYMHKRPYIISGPHLIIRRTKEILIYKIEYRPADDRQIKYEKIIAGLADEYCLARHLVAEIHNHFTMELQEYKPFDTILLSETV